MLGYIVIVADYNFRTNILFAGIAQLCDTVTNEKYDAFADSGVLRAGAGSRDNVRGGKTYYARAAAAEASAGFGDLVSVGASALSAGAHAEYGWNNSVGANLSVVRAEGNLGPVSAGVGLNFDTHAAVGVNGVSASLLGTGFSVGPRMEVKTPFFDVGVTLF
jgi:hypothetical protein